MTDPTPGARARGGDVPEAGDIEDAVGRHGAGGSPRPGEEHLFAALDRTRADLAATPRPTAPAGLTGALLAAVAAERDAGPAPAVEPRPADTPGRRRPGRRWLAAGTVGVAAAAAVLAVVVLGGGGTAPSPAPAPTAAPAPGPGSPVVLASADLPQALRSAVGARDGTADPAARAGCLVAHGLPAGTVPLGSRAVVLDGRPGTLYVLGTGRAARFRLLVVGPDCAPGSPDTLGDVTVGG
ncbi:hypothetical protein GCM10023201_29420 [Actinomycetospora corticicola]|uniref:Anti-sigma-M factor RsmA n=1 Tax=Actinomycetospora corticicola TaxID=663602 RepID=A0A7Y9J8D2_9PSEU|nr:hypothetical protein [Actinomycetospora corticicola]NYD38304.1 hypothetical protein [Actinomycetospora corticicola]